MLIENPTEVDRMEPDPGANYVNRNVGAAQGRANVGGTQFVSSVHAARLALSKPLGNWIIR